MHGLLSFTYHIDFKSFYYYITGVGSDGQLIDDQATSIVLAACRADETLPTDPLYPADIFTSCLTTPITIACRWFMIQVPTMCLQSVFFTDCAAFVCAEPALHG
jgi:hypothetical protein